MNNESSLLDFAFGREEALSFLVISKVFTLDTEAVGDLYHAVKNHLSSILMRS